MEKRKDREVKAKGAGMQISFSCSPFFNKIEYDLRNHLLKWWLFWVTGKMAIEGGTVYIE